MKLNEQIRTYRKKQNLTQEQVANYLGVSAPAVNKWESGSSYPDITLLGPLARLLKTDVDTLLSFHEELSKEEIEQYMSQLSKTLFEENYAAAYEEGMKIMKEYPKCEALVLNVTTVLLSYLQLQQADENTSYEESLLNWLSLVADSNNKELSYLAIATLAQNYSRREEYEKAHEYLNKIPDRGLDKEIWLGSLYVREGRTKEAYQIYEKMLFQSANKAVLSLQPLVQLKCKEKDYAMAKRYADLIEQASDLFELGSYNGYGTHMTVAFEEKNKEKALDYLEKMVNSLDTIESYKNSILYRDMEFDRQNPATSIRYLMKQELTTEEKYDFIKKDPRFQKIIHALEE